MSQEKKHSESKPDLKHNWTQRRWSISLIYLILVVAGLYIFQETFSESRPRKVPYSEFLQDLKAGRLKNVLISDQEVTATLEKKGSKKDKAKTEQITASRLPGIDDNTFLHELESHGVTFSGRIQENSFWLELLLSWLLPLGILHVRSE